LTTRQYELVACGLAVCLIAAHIAIKPDVEAGSRRNTDRVRLTREWRSRVAPVFDLTLRDRSTFRIADHAGRRVVILIFFTTWCDECGQDLVGLQRYVRRLQSEGKPVVAAAIDGQERADLVDRFIRTESIRLPTGIDDPGTITRAYEVASFPTTVVVGIDGRVRLYQPTEIPNPEIALDAVLDADFGALARANRLKTP
jgi:peroxiredoxin